MFNWSLNAPLEYKGEYTAFVLRFCNYAEVNNFFILFVNIKKDNNNLCNSIPTFSQR